MAHTLCWLAENQAAPPWAGALKFAVFIAGFPSRLQSQAGAEGSTPSQLQMPSLHFSAANDPRVPASHHAELAGCFVNSQLVPILNGEGKVSSTPALSVSSRWTQTTIDNYIRWAHSFDAFRRSRKPGMVRTACRSELPMPRPSPSSSRPSWPPPSWPPPPELQLRPSEPPCGWSLPPTRPPWARCPWQQLHPRARARKDSPQEEASNAVVG